MRITLAAMDSRGGVQPYLALGFGLKAAGHEVQVLAPANYGGMVEAAGLVHAPLSVDLEAEARRVGAQAHGRAFAGMRVAAREIDGWMAQLAREALDALHEQDLALGGIGGMAVALSAAERAGVPFIEAHLQPVGAPTGRYPGPLFGSTPRIAGAPGRWLSHHLSDLAMTLPFRRSAARVRSEVLGLGGSPRAHLGNPVLYGFSRHVVPMPADAAGRRHVTGYWFLPAPAGVGLSPALDAFLAADGRPAISVGFGSMAGEDPTGTAELVIGAARDAGVRLVLLTGWGGLSADEAGDDVHVTDAVPHDLLFPRVAAVVHHGGAGTTAAGIRAGVPALVVPFGVDQPFWGSRVAALGIGPAPLPRRRLTRARLAASLARMTEDRAMRASAASLAELVRAEDGVAEAVRLVGRFADARHRR
jgi:sterol 3beta-glucosyltransferase